jgi:hypothetical protein
MNTTAPIYIEVYSDILDHIQASAPCQLQSVAHWAQDQISNLAPSTFMLAIDLLISSGVIEVSAEDGVLVVDLI